MTKSVARTRSERILYWNGSVKLLIRFWVTQSAKFLGTGGAKEGLLTVMSPSPGDEVVVWWIGPTSFYAAWLATAPFTPILPRLPEEDS